MATSNRKTMGAAQWQKWLRLDGYGRSDRHRLSGFGRRFPHPGPDLGYDGRELETGSLEDADTEEYDTYWQDPVDEQAYLIASETAIIDLEGEV